MRSALALLAGFSIGFCITNTFSTTGSPFIMAVAVIAGVSFFTHLRQLMAKEQEK